MPDVTATSLARGVRIPNYKAPGQGSTAPKPFLVMPTTVARKSVRIFHQKGSAEARTYLTSSFAGWLNHSHPAMRTNATNTIGALDTYISADAADGRAFVGFGEYVIVKLPSGTIKTKVDVVTTRQKVLSGRAVFWDGKPITLDQAQVIAYPYAVAARTLYPNEPVSDICVWQVRRGTLHVVSMTNALARANDADEVLARL